MPTISFSLDTKSINKAIRDLRRYINDFDSKIIRLREMVAERIEWSASTGFRSALTGDIIRGQEPYNDVFVVVEHDDSVSVVIAEGTQAVFLEFGAGVYHNGAVGGSPHPWGAQMGYTIGTYGQGKGSRKVWGYYDGNVLTITHGTPAAMPMYNGMRDAIAVFDSLVQEVFG